MLKQNFLLAIGTPSGPDILILFAIAGLFFIGPAIFQWLWNSTFPEIFGLPHIGFWQSFRLLLIASILFGGIYHYNQPTQPANIYIGQPPYELKK
jgi:hypothetical protein